MHVLFLALGANRRRAVVDEAAQVVADGGQAVVLAEQAKPWSGESFAPGVRFVAVDRLQATHRPRRVENLVLYRGPRFLLHRVIGRGPLKRRARRAAKAYEKRVADRVHRRLFTPVYDRLFSDVRARLVDRELRRGRPFDVLVVSDPLSMPEAQRLLAGSGGRGPQVVYSIDHAVA